MIQNIYTKKEIEIDSGPANGGFSSCSLLYVEYIEHIYIYRERERDMSARQNLLCNERSLRGGYRFFLWTLFFLRSWGKLMMLL